MAKGDIRTEAIVLRRTKYGETDRIVNFLTPLGKKSAVARGSRKEKSKLASGIEMFCLSEITIHEKASAYEGLGILTSAKTKEFYQNMIMDLEMMELGSMILKKVATAADNFDAPELFTLTKECFEAINDKVSLQLVEIYFMFNLITICGEDINLITDTNGNKLKQDLKYFWDPITYSLAPNEQGNIGVDEIKIMRLILASNLRMVSRIQNIYNILPDILYIVKSFH